MASEPGIPMEAIQRQEPSTSDAAPKTDEPVPSPKHRPPPIDVTAAQNYGSNGPKTPTTGGPQTPGPSSGDKKRDKEKKIGHRRVDEEGQITYKKIQTSQIMGSIQLGIGYAVGSLASKPERDLLMQDFAMVETTYFPGDGSNITPAHHYSDFRFKTYAPVAFRYFRDLFGIQPDDFLLSLCNEPMRELTNPGASGSIFYLTLDDEFIIKTVQHKEAEFLQKLLPGYYMNLNQNPRTLLPKFFGLYCYQCGGKNVRVVVMNNLLPSSIKIHQKYDLKGSTYKRKAGKHERTKESPTFKDLDFMEFHPDGLLLEAETYNALIKTIQRDCRVLESFKIMDYSLLVGIHNLDQAAKEQAEQRQMMRKELEQHWKAHEDGMKSGAGPPSQNSESKSGTHLTRSKSINRQRLAAYSTAMESIQAEVEPIDQDEDVPPGGIPARNGKGERLLLFLGIIDILQSYRLKKKLEHTWKSMLHDGDTVSVHRPSFYAQRFQDFMAKTVFRKIPSPLKHSPSKRKGTSLRARPPSSGEADIAKMESVGALTSAAPTSTKGHDDKEAVKETSVRSNAIDESGDALPLNTVTTTDVPPSVPDASVSDTTTSTNTSLHMDPSIAARLESDVQKPRSSTDSVTNIRTGIRTSPTVIRATSGFLDQSDAVSISHITLQTESIGSVVSETSSSSTSGIGSTIRTVTWTPPHSTEGSTPTHTEGTPSFTESSSSGDVGCPTTPIRGVLHQSRDSLQPLGVTQVFHETEIQPGHHHAPNAAPMKKALSPIREDAEGVQFV